MISAPQSVVVSVIFFPMDLVYYSSDSGADYTLAREIHPLPRPIGRRHQRLNSPGRRHGILSLEVDFKGSRV